MDKFEFAKAKLYADLYKLPEDKRIELIGQFVMKHKQTVAFLTDCGPGDEGKADRYIEKLDKMYPGIRVVSVENGPVANTICIKLAPPLENDPNGPLGATSDDPNKL